MPTDRYIAKKIPDEGIEMPADSRLFDGRKYMWDGKTYGSDGEAKSTEEAYKKDGFETKIAQEGDQYLVYTRRVIKEVKVEGAP